MTKDTCPKCGGSGGGDEPHLSCTACAGTGRLSFRQRFPDDPFPPPDDDPAAEGEATMEPRRCENCETENLDGFWMPATGPDGLCDFCRKELAALDAEIARYEAEEREEQKKAGPCRHDPDIPF